MPTARAFELRDEPHDGIVLLHGITWRDYEQLLAMRGERSAPRITFLDGTAEILSPSTDHEEIKSFIGRLLETYCLEMEIPFTPFGSWTLQSKRRKGGAEPDECYVFGEQKRAARPHLAIEVVWTSGRIDKLEVYRRLGVQEVWWWEDGRIQPYALRGERYVKIKKSRSLPELDLLARFLDRPTAYHAIRDYRAALRKSPRRSKR